MTLSLRNAQPQDRDAVIALMYSAGPEYLEYAFTHGEHTATRFMQFAFTDGGGFFGWRTHCVAELDGAPVGIAAFYSGRDYFGLSNALTLQALRFYPLHVFPRVVRRALQLKALMPPPSRATHFVANFGVHPKCRSQGIGSALLRHQQDIGRQRGRSVYALDVAVTNPRGQALYERFGFRVVRERRFPGPTGAAPDSRRMEMAL